MAGNANSGGRNALSPQMHVLKGTFQASRHAGHDTPEPPKGEPRRPPKLSTTARAEWDRMVARLADTGALSRVDDAALYQYVNLYAETEAIAARGAQIQQLLKTAKRAMLQLEGAELLQALDQVIKLQGLLSRQSVQLRQGHMAIRQYLVEFGMTPAARTRVKLPPKSREQSRAEQFRASKAGA